MTNLNKYHIQSNVLKVHEGGRRMCTITIITPKPSAQVLEELYAEARRRLETLRQDLVSEIMMALGASGDRAAAKIHQTLDQVLT
jgi:hypothetical protein